MLLRFHNCPLLKSVDIFCSETIFVSYWKILQLYKILTFLESNRCTVYRAIYSFKNHNIAKTTFSEFLHSGPPFCLFLNMVLHFFTSLGLKLQFLDTISFFRTFKKCPFPFWLLYLCFSLSGLSVNTTLSGPLLSRFDIVLVLLDTQNTGWDEIVSSHILKEVVSVKLESFYWLDLEYTWSIGLKLIYKLSVLKQKI